MFQLLLAIIYIAFISLGLPDSLLGAAWPSMYQEFSVPVSYAGIISMIISAGTIVSSLQSDRLTKKLGAGKVTAISVGITAIALMGFSVSHSFLVLCLWSIPYGLGAGSVDAALNNYVALHYESRHMSWLHCMWGVGTSVSPYVMSYALSGGESWNTGYRYIGIFQMVLTAILVFSLPLWKRPQDSLQGIREETNSNTGTGRCQEQKSNIKSKTVAEAKPLTLKEIFSIKGAKEIMIVFFCYCALEQTAGLWASSYLVLNRGVTVERAASFASLFYLGITIGRAISGFLTMRMNDKSMIRLGQGIILLGILVLFLPVSNDIVPLIGLILVGLGCAPIYPCVIHSTPELFGADKSQAIIGVQMASAYVGSCLAPPCFGWLANHVSIGLYPVFLVIILAVMIFLHERLQQLKM